MGRCWTSAFDHSHANTLMTRSRKIIACIIGLLLLYSAGLAVRRVVLEAQFQLAGENLPYTLESALNFRRIEQVYYAGAMPEVDHAVEFPSGIVVRKTDTVGAECVYAFLARLFPISVPLANRIRWIEAAWFCLGIPLMALWVWWWRRSAWGGAIAAGFYAVALSSVIRSTGQEISHENFALPLLIGHLAFSVLAARGTSAILRRAGVGVSALLLALALATWDLVQFYVMIWMAVHLVRFARAGQGERASEKAQWMIHVGALVLIGLLNPYLRAHAFLLSPAMLIGYGMVASAAVRWASGSGVCGSKWGRPGRLWIVLLVPLLIGLALSSGYVASYGHFGELLLAKLRFLNHKPADPSLLTFDQRIMWVPALHSANIALTASLFPVMLPLTLVVAVVLFVSALVSLRRSKNQPDPELFQYLVFYAVSLAAFVLFVRFHVFLAIFSAVLLGVWAASGRKWFVRVLILSVLVTGMAVEAANTLKKPERWGRWVYYKEIEELTDWMHRYVSPEPVLANFGVSASILTYGECPILLHPKFESKEIRERVRGYGEKLFKGTEEELRDWAGRYGAQYYVYALGEFSSISPEQQMRYFVNALDPSTNCPARIFEFDMDRTTCFRFLWGNRKYRVFKILNGEEDAVANRFSDLAEKALERGSLEEAENRAVAGLLVCPESARTQEILRHVEVLKDQGFQGQGTNVISR
jgi:hypothetical protein